jgi:hypothetical protein
MYYMGDGAGEQGEEDCPRMGTNRPELGKKAWLRRWLICLNSRRSTTAGVFGWYSMKRYTQESGRIWGRELFEHWSFEFDSNFEFRHSNFPPKHPTHPPLPPAP